ncbi:hypothetical protein O3P69_002471 [Scylla paramamosain]|uniref:Uncharacterized protein n=1 Tax=Scylla paramamosain TaxID=85552 RepID=A0AAW0UKK8_SCYPA
MSSCDMGTRQVETDAAQYYPFIFMSKNGPSYKVTGSMTEVLDTIAKKLNFWQEADMTAVVVGLDEERTSVVDFSDFLYIDQNSIVYKRPVLESDMAGFLKPYTATVRKRQMSLRFPMAVL